MAPSATRASATASRGGRPLEFDPDQALGTIIDLFWRKGFRGASMADIEHATGLKRTSVYNYFGSKDALIRHAVETYSEMVFAALTEPLVHGERGLDDVDAFFAALGTAAATPGMPHGCLVASYVGELVSIDEVSDQPRRFLDRIGAALVAALTRAAHAGEIPAESVQRRAQLLEAAMIGINVAGPAFEGHDRTVAAANAVRAEVRSWRLPPG